jgi:hypothetical protein
MQRLRLASCLCAALALATPVVAQQSLQWDTAAPVWVQTKALLCKATVLHWCFLDGACRRDQPAALWKIDFERNKIDYQTVEGSEEIVAKHARKEPYDGLRMSLLLASGRVMEFRYDKAGTVAAWSMVIPHPLEPLKPGTLIFEWQCHAP